MIKNPLYNEGLTILSYILGKTPKTNLIERYCRAVLTKTGNPVAILFPGLIRKFPFLLCLIEPVGQKKTPILTAFKDRLNIAMVLVDTSIEGTKLFYNIDSRRRIQLILKMIIYIFIEIILFPIRLLPLIKLLKYEKS